MIVTRWSQLSPETQVLILTVAGGVGAAQIEAVKDRVIPQLANHPHWSTLGGGFFMILSLLVRPEVRAYILFKKKQIQSKNPETGEITNSTNTEIQLPPKE